MLEKIVDCCRGSPSAFEEWFYSSWEAILKPELHILCIYDYLNISKSELGFVDENLVRRNTLTSSNEFLQGSKVTFLEEFEGSASAGNSPARPASNKGLASRLFSRTQSQEPESTHVRRCSATSYPSLVSTHLEDLFRSLALVRDPFGWKIGGTPWRWLETSRIMWGELGWFST